ncbi:hypothetical protein CsatB_027949 [Cannabis sativa]
MNINTPSTSFINQDGSSAFDFGELEQAIALQGVKISGGNDHHHHHHEVNNNNNNKTTLFTTSSSNTNNNNNNNNRPAATLEMFPSWPMRYHQTPRASSKSGGGGDDSTDNSGSAKADQTQLESESPLSNNNINNIINHNQKNQPSFDYDHQQQQQQQLQENNSSKLQSSNSKHTQEKRKGAGSTSEKPLDAKTLRRLAQNREAARKSRLRKKAYVQQLESSRIKLTQLEQDLQRARAQGLFLGACGGASGNISPGAAIFDMEYGRWLEDDQRHMTELRTSLQAHLPEGDLRMIIDGYISHYDEIFRLKAVAAKSDVFHLITGMWTTPAERCFLWMGGFRPSDLIKMLIAQLDPLTDQQLMGIYSLQQSSQQAEEALSQGLEQLQQSLVDTIAGSPVIVDGMQQMAVALGKLSNLEGFVRQADNLRQQTLHQLRRTLTVRQAARCFVVIGEYYGRLRALSSLWASRPRDTNNNINQSMVVNDDTTSCQTTTDLQMVHHQHPHDPHHHHHHFSSF